MIVIGHSNRGNLKVIPVSSNPPNPHKPVKSLAPSARIRGEAYMGNLVVIPPSRVTTLARKGGGCYRRSVKVRGLFW